MKNGHELPDKEHAKNAPFLLPIEDVFTIPGRGTVVTGQVQRGQIKQNDEVEIVGVTPTRKTVVIGIEMFNKIVDSAIAEDNVGLLLRDVDKKEIQRGQVLAQPGSIRPHTVFKALIYSLPAEKGGRQKPIAAGDSPGFYFRTTDTAGAVELPAGEDVVMPGGRAEITVELAQPIALEKGLRFIIREDRQKVAVGQIIDIVK